MIPGLWHETARRERTGGGGPSRLPHCARKPAARAVQSGSGLRLVGCHPRIRPWRLAVGACEHDEIAIRIAEPDLAMSRPARAVRRVAVRRQHDVGVERFSAANRVVEIVDLEPERDAVAVRPRRWVADWAMVMLDSEAMQLEHEASVAKQALVFLSTVPAVTTEQLLIPTTAPRNVGDRDQRLRSHEARESKEARTNRFPFARSPGEPNCDHVDEDLSPSLGSVGPCHAKEVRHAVSGGLRASN